MTPSTSGLDPATRVLIQLSAAIAASDEATIRYWLLEAARDVPPVQVEELVLQSYLFCGFPRALNAAREWRRVSQQTAFFHLGKLVENGPTETIFTNPRESRTRDYITGRFG